jgi:hypothetical protein
MHVVCKYPSAGALVWQYGLTGMAGTAPGELNHPRRLRPAAAGRLNADAPHDRIDGTPGIAAAPIRMLGLADGGASISTTRVDWTSGWGISSSPATSELASSEVEPQFRCHGRGTRKYTAAAAPANARSAPTRLIFTLASASTGTGGRTRT